MVGILARFLKHLFKSLQLELQTTTVDQCYWLSKLLFGFSYYCLCFLTMAIRKIPVQYARRTTSGDFEQDMMVVDNGFH
jgi:preprotein translocase subunit SecY